MPVNHERLNRQARVARERREVIDRCVTCPDRKPGFELKPLGDSRTTVKSANRAAMTNRAKRVKVTLAPVSL